MSGCLTRVQFMRHTRRQADPFVCGLFCTLSDDATRVPSRSTRRPMLTQPLRRDANGRVRSTRTKWQLKYPMHTVFVCGAWKCPTQHIETNSHIHTETPTDILANKRYDMRCYARTAYPQITICSSVSGNALICTLYISICTMCVCLCIYTYIYVYNIMRLNCL